jgi:hypothetical protein
MTTKYLLVYFDNAAYIHNEVDEYISECIQLLWSDIYRNKCLKLSSNTLLLRVFESDFDSYPYPKDRIDDVRAMVHSNYQLNYYISALKTYVLPINLIDIKDQTDGLEKELEYLEQLVK